MKVTATALPEVLILEPRVFEDDRGFFMESWNRRTFAAATGLDVDFVQDNHSRSKCGVLRGIHYQLKKPQGKLVRVVSGSVFDVAIDLRRSSPSFRRWVGVELSADNRRQLWIPPGFGHGFLVRSEWADVLYKATEYWRAELDRTVRWDDPAMGVDWGSDVATQLLAPKDKAAPPLSESEAFD